MQQEFLELAKQIDDNENAINDALEQDDFDTAAELAGQKVELFKRLAELSAQVEDHKSIEPYLQKLYEEQVEQLAILHEQHELMRQELMKIKRGGKGQKAYQRVRAYLGTR